MPIGKDKVRPDWPIDITTEELFREFVVKKHGIYAKGMFGQEANKALLAWMRPFLKSKGIDFSRLGHTHTNIDNKREKKALEASKLLEEIMKYLVSMCGLERQPTQPVLRVSTPTLRAAICAVEGIKDKRTIANRIAFLDSHGLIQVGEKESFYEMVCRPISSAPVQDSNGHMAGPPRGVTG